MHLPRLSLLTLAFATLLGITGAVSATPPGQSPPANTAPPAISGTPQVGQTLSGSVGTWSGPTPTLSAQWQRCDSAGANCASIGGATGQTYAPQSADVGARLRFLVTATNKNGSASASSDATAAVQAASGGGSDTTPPSVSFTSPADNPPGGYTSLSGVVTLSANASDNVGVAAVSFYFGSTLIATDAAAPYSASFDASTQPNGQTSTLKAVAKDAAGNQASDQIYVQVSSGSGGSSTSTTISPSTLSGGTAGSAYSQQLSASGPTPPYTFKVSQGSLPSGLSLSSGGLLSGTPSASGSFSFTVAAAASTGATVASQSYTLSVAPASSGGSATISPSTLPGATAGSAYSKQLSASGPTPPYSFKVSQGSLPSGVSLSSGGLLSGTPSASGSFPFTVAAGDSTGATVASQSYTLAVSPSSSGGGGPKLLWAPPALTNPITIPAPSGGGSVTLDNTKDYRIQLGHVTGPLTINGGHNVVIIGGQITATPVWSSDRSQESKGYALLLDGGDPSGTVHVEGVLIDQSNDAITIRTKRTVQLENIRVSNNHAPKDDWSSAHPDIIQTWDAGQIRVDHFTGYSDYQGFTWMRGTTSQSFPSRVTLRHCNLRALAPTPDSVSNTTGGKPIMGDVDWHVGQSTVFDEQDVWAETGWYSSTYQRKLDDVMGGYGSPDGAPYTQPQYQISGLDGRSWISTDPASSGGISGSVGYSDNLGRRQGDTMHWLKTFTNSTWTWGVPSGGDFVPSTLVGVGYVSPGYL